MEEKKTLWIIIGIGVCIVIVVAVGFFWFLPSDQSLASAGSERTPAAAGSTGFDPVEMVRKDDAFVGINEITEQTEDFVVVSDELVYGLPESTDEDASAENNTDLSSETITLDVPVAETVNNVAVVEIAAAPVRSVPVVREPEPEVKKTVKITEYWIQAGSFSSLAKATDVKNKLNEKGATSTISTTNVNGTDYFRVRLGPYSEQMEADKFLTWIKAVKGFESSYISEVYVTK